MPASSFRPDEVSFLRSKLGDWQQMKAKPVNKGNVDILIRERRQFIRSVIVDLLSKFPDRDPSVSDPSGVTYTQEDLERLPERVRQWFRNNTRVPLEAESQKKHKTKSRTHARNLAAKRYRQPVKERARELREVDNNLKPMTAFNRALTEFMNELKKEDPEAHAKLYDDAQELRSAPKKDFTELTPNSLALLLEAFPKRLLSDLEHYGKELPVHIWCIAAFAKPPDHKLEAFTLSTPSLDAMSNSTFDQTTRQMMLNWLKENLGASSTLQVETATPMIYPALRRGARPCLPLANHIRNIPIHQLRSWLRTYFNYHYIWQGGSKSVPWKLIGRDNGFKYIPRECFPPGIKFLQSPNDMSRADLESWYQWILDGQEGRLLDSQIFRFAHIERGSSTPLTYLDPIVSRPEMCKLIWSPDEKLYGAKVQKMAEDAQLKPTWNELPLARLQCVYHPFSEKVRSAMSNGCLPDYRTRDLVELLFMMERFGPIHTRAVACKEAMNAHMKNYSSEEQLMRLLVGPPLKPAALLENMDEHSELSLSTFINYVKTTERFRHLASGTWRAGPFGVRWLVVIYVHFAAAFSVYEKIPQSLPTDRVDAFEKSNFSRLKEGLMNLGAWLYRSLTESINILKETFHERSDAWKQAVVAAHLNDSESSIGNDSVTLNTHGVPRSRSMLQSCYEHIQLADPDLTLGEDSIPQQQLLRRLRKKAVTSLELDKDELSDHDSTSGEEIEFPSESESEDNSDEQSDEQSNTADNVSDIELGLYHSRVMEHNPLNQEEAQLEVEFDKDAQSEAQASTAEDTDGEGDALPNLVLSELTPCKPRPTTLTEKSMISENSLVPLNIHPFAKQSEVQASTAEDTDGEGDILPNSVLSELTPSKSRPTTPSSKSNAKMIMEVVINTPRKKMAKFQEPPSQNNSSVPKNKGDEVSEGSPSDSRPPATRRSRRSIGRSAQAEEAIRQAKKGNYSKKK